MTIEGIPEVLSTSLTGLSENPFMIMLFINVVLFIAGIFLNPGFSSLCSLPSCFPSLKAEAAMFSAQLAEPQKFKNGH